jgi:hypothetical protein
VTKKKKKKAQKKIENIKKPKKIENRKSQKKSPFLPPSLLNRIAFSLLYLATQTPGVYTIVFVGDSYCEGDVLHPSSCQVEQPPLVKPYSICKQQ